ncbi:DNA polymerase V [Fibrobacter sp. UWB15]|uniref:Y-family DNA polymerase n=1 Tax=unclassified Fibrobacter TaxID=2634177 RepID=UPI000912882A|nr:MULTISPECIES: DNA methylase [unclassified Fibrobacter]PWJ63157.1 DNA polymerase V [Fibrobacter sp. UWB6]SHG41421.1 DNA polymerase V [Fibrobacter sp. UWB8]SMG38143.1 DNA polymerase V [Fibrobacter sp. UWB15]
MNQPRESRTYAAIDLKSFFASVECILRGLNPLKAKLVVADESRTEKTICLAVTPALKAYGIPGRARLFEVNQKVREVLRRTGEKIEFTIAKPQMAKYVEYSTKVYNVYLKYVSAEDIHAYSIDECFLDLTKYLKLYKKTARELVKTIIQDVFATTGITATGGIGTNLYLCKIAMDVMAKHVDADADGVRIAELDEMSYRKQLWAHRPLTSFWQVGRGIAERLENCRLNAGRGIYTMGDIARVSVKNPEALYKLFGVNAEILIDHAWGYEPCTIADIKKSKPRNRSTGEGQVLQDPYPFDKARLVVREMVDTVSMTLIAHDLVTNAMVLTVGYDRENVDNGIYHGVTVTDFYGRTIPKPAHGTASIGYYTSSQSVMADAVMKLFDRIVDPKLTVRRLNLVAADIVDASHEQYDLFTDVQKQEKEKKRLKAELLIKKRFGKNAIVKGMDLQEGATTIERNGQIGGHRA